MKQKKIVHVLSGGLDSTTLLYALLKKGHEVKCISFDYGQKHLKEVMQAQKTCLDLGIEHHIVDLTSVKNLISNSALTSDQPIPEGHYKDESMRATVVPSRNTIMAAIAQGYAVNIDFDAISLGIHSGDHAIYPDCRPEFIHYLRRTFALNNYKPIRVLAPFLKVSKIKIVELGLQLGVKFENTWTCYVGAEKPCQKCGACVERAEAFAANNATDPLS